MLCRSGTAGLRSSSRAGRSSSALAGAAGIVIRDLVGLEESFGGVDTSRFEGAESTFRGGLATAPVGLFSGAPTFELSAGDVVRGSRPLKTRDRRSSSSSGAPGVRVAAPVPRSGMVVIRSFVGGLTTEGRSLADVPSRAATGRAGKPSRNGCELSARRASASSARCALTVSFPIARAGAVVTARR